MNGSHFDVWTRRRFGLATGGALAALGLASFDAAEGRRKKRKKRCRKLHQTCDLDGKTKRCCKDLACIDETNDPDVGACCRPAQMSCEEESQCCLSFECQQAIELLGKRCCAPFGVFCQEDSDCCAAEGVRCDPLRNCCRGVQAPCVADDGYECCQPLRCANVPALGGLHCCANDGDACGVQDDCCFGMGCFDGHCAD
jgi:hypothetical protein